MHSLTAPSDRHAVKLKDPLSEEETIEAMGTLRKDIRFTQVDRYYADPQIPQQRIVLVSFIPARGAKPDKDNIYGMMKVRGVYATEEEANERSEFLIRNVDSYHEIYHAYVGRPFPITTAQGFEQEIKTIDIRRKTTELISEDILSKKKEERSEMETLKDREKNLLEESKRAQREEAIDPYDRYITEQVKRAQLIWTFHEMNKKMEQMRTSFHSTTKVIRDLENEHPDFIHSYKDKYMAARREAGIPDDDNSFIQYLGLDLDIGIEDMQEYVAKLRGNTTTIVSIDTKSDETENVG